MLKVLFFNIVYKECHFISIEYKFIYFWSNISITSRRDVLHSIFIFTFIIVLFLCNLSLLFPELQQDVVVIQAFSHACLCSCNIIYLTVPRL